MIQEYKGITYYTYSEIQEMGIYFKLTRPLYNDLGLSLWKYSFKGNTFLGVSHFLHMKYKKQWSLFPEIFKSTTLTEVKLHIIWALSQNLGLTNLLSFLNMARIL